MWISLKTLGLQVLETFADHHGPSLLAELLSDSDGFISRLVCSSSDSS